MKSLILTGWFWEDYACSAAVALRHYKTADIKGVSTRRLPEMLNEITGYKEVAILGVGLSGEQELLEQALEKLKKNKVRVRWISSMAMPEYISEKIRSNIEIFISDTTLTEAASQYFKVPYDDIAFLLKSGKTSEKVKHYKMFLEAAMYAYRNFQDERPYGRVICHIANNDPESLWSDMDKKLIENYKRYGSRELAGKSETITALREQINIAAPHDHARVMIQGETGTGKETVALLLHLKSPRCNEPFIAFNCATTTPNLLESRFAGYEKGAFTGANERKAGIFEQANGGTLFLDEIGELPFEAQGLLLRILEEQRFNRMGGTEEITVDVRVLCGTNRDLPRMVQEGKFRQDLFYRLNVVQIHTPALREHKSDIGYLADTYWLKQHRRRLSAEQIEALKDYDYPGNVRELNNLLERASVMGENDFSKLIAEHKIMCRSIAAELPKAEVPDDLETVICRHVKQVFEKYEKNLTQSSQALGISRNTVRKYLEMQD